MPPSRAVAFAIKEFKKVVPPVVFFAVGFSLIEQTTQLVLDDYLARVADCVVAATVTLVVGKDVLAAILLPFLRGFDTAPQIMRPNAGLLTLITVIALDLACAQTQVLANTPANYTKATDDDLSKESENPVTMMITLPLRYEADFDDAAYHATKDTFELDQAVVPFKLNDDWALITRTKLPGYSEPPKKLGDHWESGLGNGYTTFFLSPVQGNGFYWGAGPVLYYPTATNTAVGVNKWGSGPSVAFVVKSSASPWVVGAVANNIWSFGGPPGSSDRTNSLLINPFISYHFGDGWAVGSSPNLAADWTAKAGQVWTVPVGGGISKTFRVGGQPIKLSVDSYYNAIRPQAGNETWLLQVTLTFLFAT